jgi:hypothetical protein
MMVRGFFILILMLISVIVHSQTGTDASGVYKNSAENILLGDSRLIVGGYGEVHYNQLLDSEIKSNGKMDVHRIVMLLGYNFNSKTQFVTELEFEHVKEVYVEQAFLHHKINRFLNLRGGLMLVPMGIINEYHEPTTFNGVERPLIDKYIAPTTWREIGFGITGNILAASVKYQAYVMNGFNGYDGVAKLNGENGLRKGRQKGAESYISSPNFAGKVEYYGIRGLNIGLSGYFGKTQSTLYDGIDDNNRAALAMADSSVVGVSMIGLDIRYTFDALQIRGQYYYSALSNSDQYNAFTAENGIMNDVGSSMTGYYIEAGYDVLRSSNSEMQLFPFVRYEFLNTHNSVGNNISVNPVYEKDIITTGLTLKLTNGAVAKTDMQFVKNGNENSYDKTFNVGIGVMF